MLTRFRKNLAWRWKVYWSTSPNWPFIWFSCLCHRSLIYAPFSKIPSHGVHMYSRGSKQREPINYHLCQVPIKSPKHHKRVVLYRKFSSTFSRRCISFLPWPKSLAAWASRGYLDTGRRGCRSVMVRTIP